MSSTKVRNFLSSLKKGTDGQPSVDSEPKMGSVILFTRLLNGREYDGSTIVTTRAGKDIFLEDILNSRVTNVVRRDGTKGADYPLAWDLSQAEVSKLIGWLESQPAKNSKNSGNSRNSAPKAAPSVPKTDELSQAEFVEALGILMDSKLDERLGSNAAQPAEDHRKVGPAKPVENSVIEINIGDVVSIGGHPVQVVGNADKGFRFNKMIRPRNEVLQQS